MTDTELIAAEVESEPEDQVTRKRGLQGTRLVVVIAAVAVVSLLAGIAIMQFIISPAEQAARTEAPTPGPITAPVESRVISNTVIARGEVTYDDPIDATIDTAGILERPIVTGHVPEVGTVLASGNVALEVAGRPVIVLPGELPAYRNLSVGMRGPDVVQLKQALAALDIWPGDVNSDYFEADTAWGVSALYERLGYVAYTGGDEAQQAVQSAERAVRDANVTVHQAEAEMARAREAGETDLYPMQVQVDSAYAMLNDAQTTLNEAYVRAMPSLPSGEVLYLTSLPRRVDEVRVKRGDTLQASPLTVSGATLTIRGTIGQQDADLLTPDMTAFYQIPGGKELEAKLLRIEQPTSKEPAEDGKPEQSAATRNTFVLAPGELTPEEISALRGTNVRVRIPVQSTDGEVLAVPIAALSAASDGSSRVELFLGTTDNPDLSEMVKVTTGLAADGYVEIKSEDSRIKPGAKIVVGR